MLTKKQGMKNKKYLKLDKGQNIQTKKNKHRASKSVYNRKI